MGNPTPYYFSTHTSSTQVAICKLFNFFQIKLFFYLIIIRVWVHQGVWVVVGALHEKQRLEHHCFHVQNVVEQLWAES